MTAPTHTTHATNATNATTPSAAPAIDGDLTVLHLGLGSFHRAHLAVYLNRLMNPPAASSVAAAAATAENLAAVPARNWSIVGGNLRNDGAAVLSALMAQHGDYTLETVAPNGARDYELIRSIRRVLPFDAALTGLIEVAATPSTRIISFTVTEAGYYLDADHKLDLSHADLCSDLEGRTRSTIYGALAALLQARMQCSAGAVTLLNCDNLRGNGDRLRAGLLEFLERRGEGVLQQWVLTHTTCPNSMVDRITPRPSAEIAPRVKAQTGRDDAAPVMAERFIQWVVEDRFANGRPAWESVGVEMVTSVHAHEEVKIRLLNATHSCIAWAATLQGLTYIHEGVGVAAIRQMAFDYVTHDAIPCLTPADHASPIDLPRYRDEVLDRFSNPFLLDTNQRVAMDGFSKIPGFIVPTLRECLERGASIASTAMLPALFFAVLGRWHRGELAYAYQDGVMDAQVAHAFFSAPDPLLAFCSNPELWGPLAGDATLVAAIRAADVRVQAFLNP